MSTINLGSIEKIPLGQGSEPHECVKTYVVREASGEILLEV